MIPMSFSVDLGDLANLNNIKNLSTNGFSARFSNVILLGRIRARVENEEFILGKHLVLDKDCALWVMDVMAIKDVAGEIGPKGPKGVYLTVGTVCITGPANIKAEGALVFVGGKKRVLDGKTKHMPLALECYLPYNKWSAFVFKGKEDGKWVLGPCDIMPLKRANVVSQDLQRIIEPYLTCGEFEYPTNAWSRGVLSWNGSNRSDEDGLALPSKGSITWRYQNEDGYRLIDNECRATWGIQKAESKIMDPRNKMGVQQDESDVQDYVNGEITGENEGKASDQEVFTGWNAMRKGEEGVGFGKPNKVLLDAVLNNVNMWSSTLNTCLSTAKKEVSDDFIKKVGEVWNNNVTGLRRSVPVFNDATGNNWLRRMLSAWVIGELRKVDEAVYSNFGRVSKYDMARQHMLPSQYDYLNSDVSLLELGAKVILLSTGIHNETSGRGFGWYSKSSALIERLCTFNPVYATTKGRLVDAAKMIVKYGSVAVRNAGLCEFTKEGRSLYIKTSGCADVWGNVYQSFKDGTFKKKSILDELFRPVQANTQTQGIHEILVNANKEYSSDDWLDAQCQDVGCFLDVEDGEGKLPTKYYSLVDSARSIVLWNRLASCEDNIWDTSEESVKAAISEMEAEKGFSLDDTQKNAVEVLSSGGLGVLTGVAGSGKSTVLKCVINAVVKSNPKVAVVQAAPTGKAAKRMVETTGLESRTMHSTFKIMQDNVNNLRWLYKATTKGDLSDVDVSGYEGLDDTFFIFDEVSMCGFNLMCKVMAAVCRSKHCKVLFVGDKEQLPPVQDSPVFAEILQISKKAYRLGESHRAAEGSLPTKNAYKVLKGEGGSFEEGDTFRICNVPNGSIAPTVLSEFLKGIKKYGIDGCRVVTPYKNAKSVERWGYSSAKISNVLGDALEKSGIVANVPGAPQSPVVVAWKSTYALEMIRIGDRVMNTENKRDVPVVDASGKVIGSQDIVNGQEGVVMAFVQGSLKYSNSTKGFEKQYLVLIDMSDDADGLTDEEKGYCAFEVTDRSNYAGNMEGLPPTCKYVTGPDISNLEMSYAETVHKMQGSEVPCVIIPASTECRDSAFFNRALVYTAITRAGKEVVLVGDAGDNGSAFAKASKRGAKEDPRETLFGYLGVLK